jgi:hypothetical protein
MRQVFKIHDNPGLVRDSETSAILTTDKSSLEKYKTQREFQQKRLKEQAAIVDRQNKLEADLSEIKNLLQALVTKVT